jgi:hypothetical protein
MLCPYHKGGKSWDNKTRKYKGLYKNENINIQNKINILKNLKNFKHKTDDEIKEYIFKEKFDKSQERGIKTLVEKMCVVFNSDVKELTNEELLFLREKQNWLKFVAPRLSSLFVEQTKQEVKQDTTLNIKWESEPDLIDVSADTVSDTSNSKDL